MASVPPKTVASMSMGALALSGVYVIGQRVLRKRVEQQFDLQMEELAHRILAIQSLRHQGGQAAQVAQILDRLEQMGIAIPRHNVDPEDEAAEGLEFAPNYGDIHLTFTERLSLLLRPRTNDRTSYKMLIALEQILRELGDACDAAGIQLGIETNRSAK